MHLSPDTYQSQTAAGLCADPFFQEWVFYPLGTTREFFLRLLIGDAPIAAQMQDAQRTLLQFSKESRIVIQALEAYVQLKQQLDSIDQSDKGFALVAECWMWLGAFISSYHFDSLAEEMHFFKWIEPLFGQERELYSLLHHAELFSSVDSQFWNRQPARLERLRVEHARVLHAYTTGDTERDELWYCRSDYHDRTVTGEKIGKYLGMKRYLQHIAYKMEEAAQRIPLTPPNTLL